MNPTPAFRRLSAILPGLALVLSLAVSIYDPQGTGTLLQNQVFDLYQRLLPRLAGTQGSHAVYIDIDAETAKRYGAWPWPRKTLNALVAHVRDAGARTIVIDMALPDADPTEAGQLLRLWSPLPAEEGFPGLGKSLARLPNHERELVALLTSTKSVVSFVPGKIAYEGPRAPAKRSVIAPAGGDPRHFMANYDNWRASLALFETAANGNGAALPEGSPGATVRGLPMLVELDGTLYPSNVLEALRVAHGGKGYRAVVATPENGFSLAIEPGIERVEIEGTDLLARTLKDGCLRLYFGDAGMLAGRIAIIGVSANGSQRLHDTPVGIPMAAGALAANAIDQIADGSFLVRPGWASVAEQLFILVGGVIVILVVRRFRFRWGLLLTLLATGGAAYGSWWAFETNRWLIDPALGGVTLLVAAFTCALMTRLHTEDEIRFVETQFGRRLSSGALARVKANPRMIRAEGSLRDVTSVVVGLQHHRRPLPRRPDRLCRHPQPFLLADDKDRAGPERHGGPHCGRRALCGLERTARRKRPCLERV